MTPLAIILIWAIAICVCAPLLGRILNRRAAEYPIDESEHFERVER